MRKPLFMLILLVSALSSAFAQAWEKPLPPAEDLGSLTSSQIVYVYNVNADAFLMYGMTSNNQVCAARLTNGDHTESIPNQHYVFVTDGKVKIRNKERGNSYYVSCVSDKAYDVVMNRNTNPEFTYTEVESGSRIYTLNNVTYGKNLDVSWTYGGHLTLVDGTNQTEWAFIKESNVTNGSYALYKAKKRMYDIYAALAENGKLENNKTALDEAYTTFADAKATADDVIKASRKLFKSVSVDITSPLNVSFLLDNADMVGNATADKWISSNPTFGWEEFEIYHSAFTLEQENVIPLGTYDLGLHSLYREDGSGTAPTLTVKTGKGTYTGKTPLMGSIDYAVTNTTDNNWTTSNGKIQPNGMQSCGQALAHGDAMTWTKDIVVDAEGTISIKYAVTSSSQWVNWQGFELIFTGLSREDILISLRAAIDDATAVYADGTGIGATALKSVIDNANTVYADANASNKELKSAADALVLAVKTYKYSNASVENPIDMTSLIINPSFEKNKEGWDVIDMQTQGNTAFKQKAGSTYIEKWTGKGNAVGDASVLQTIENLDMGIYQLVAAAQNIQENTPNASQSGAWIVANNSKEPVDKTAQYTLTFTNIESSTIIGFIAKGATGNWLAADNFRLYYVGADDAAYKAGLQEYIDNAIAVAGKKMHTATLQDLNDCIATAQAELAKTETSGILKVSTPLRIATETAQVSIDAYAELLAAIEVAEGYYGNGTSIGAEDFLAAINTAKAAYADGTTTFEELKNQINLLDAAAFAYKLNEPTGAIPKITKTDKRYARGSVMAFGRFTYSLNGATLREAGFCYSTEKNPTIEDQRSTRYFDSNGRIYVMENMTPATVYYARPYVLTEGYQVAYGDEIKIITIPKGTMTWSWNYGGSAEENDRIVSAMGYGMEVWNSLMSLGGFHLTGNYGSGTPTADCSYGGWMRIGPNTSYQRTGTIMHEAAHGVGVGTHWTWGTILQNGTWTGTRANAVLQFWDNNTTSKMAGDGMHMWPYGINGAHEDNGSDQLYYANALIIQAMHEDGLQPTGSRFASPAYTFEHDDEVKYYIKNESAAGGLNTSYLGVDGSTLAWKAATSTDVAADDSFAWYLSFDPKTQYYSFRNAATGEYITLSGSTFKTVSRTVPTAADKFHLMTGRRDVKVGSGTNAMNVRGYWVLRANGDWANAMTATSGGKVSLSNFDIAADAATQHWVILTAEETAKFDNAARMSAVTELKALIESLKKLKETPHTENVADVDVALNTAIVAAEAVANDDASTLDVVNTTLASTLQAGMDFLGNATPTEVANPFDITFLMADPSITTAEGWAVSKAVQSSCIEYYEQTFDFYQIVNNLPAGTYSLKVQGFNRPGKTEDVWADYQKGKDNSVAYLYAGSESQKLNNLAVDASTTKVHSDDLTMTSPKAYVPCTISSGAAYFRKGLYDNELVFNITKVTNLRLGIKQSTATSLYWTFFDNFRLYYYGSKTKEEVTEVEDIVISELLFATPKDIYSINGTMVRQAATDLEGLAPGIYIVDRKKVVVR